MTSRDVVVYGATGALGSHVAGELAARGIAVILAGRNGVQLRALPGAEHGVRVATIDDPASLRTAFAGARLVVNCAPAERTGVAVLAAAIAAGAGYLDAADEQGFVRTAYERHESAARRAGVAVVSGMGFAIAVGDLAAAWAASGLVGDPPGRGPGGALARGEAPGRIADEEPLDEVAVSYVFDGDGSTAARLAAEALFAPGVEWRCDRWDPVSPAATRRRINAGRELGGERDAVAVPLGDVITVPRHIAARRVATFASLTRSRWATRALDVAGRFAALLAPSPGVAPRTGGLGAAIRGLVPDAGFVLGSAPLPPDLRARARFAVIAQCRRGFDAAQVRVTGADAHHVGALMLVEAAAALASRHAGPVGVLAPAEAFAPAALLTAVADRADLSIDTSFLPS